MADPLQLSTGLQSYASGSVFTLGSVPDPPADCDSPRAAIRVEIKDGHHSRTFSCGMLVDILSELEIPSDPAESSLTSTARTGFLKLYDWRCAYHFRHRSGAEDWTAEAETDYTKLIQDGKLEEFLAQIHVNDDLWGKVDPGWTPGQQEAFLAHKMLRMYRAETTAYARLAEFQGKLVPRLLSAVVLDTAPEDVQGHHRKHFRVWGILLQFIPGFSLSRLAKSAPPSSWQSIVDQAIQIVHVLGDKEILN